VSRVIDERPAVSDQPPPDADVLIEEAHRRHRKRQFRVAIVLVVVIGLGLGVGFGVSGPGGGGIPLGSSSGGELGGTATSTGSRSAQIIESAHIPPSTYRLAVDHGRIVVIAGQGSSCSARLFDPSTLHLDTGDARCSATDASPFLPTDLVVDTSGIDVAIKVSTTNPLTRVSTVGPTLATLQTEWGWAHSGAVEGNGDVWIYELGGFEDGTKQSSTLLEVSTSTGAVLHRFAISLGENPYMVVDADGFWITGSPWGGTSCTESCTLWHVAPGSSQLVAARTLGIRTQWLMASGHSIYADVLTGVSGGWRQTIWRLDGPGARVAYKTPATLLPSPDFSPDTGYFVVGSSQEGYFTTTQLGNGTTPVGIGDCDTKAPLQIIRINPATGGQRYVATLTRSESGADFDCFLGDSQAVVYRGSIYLLAGVWDDLGATQRLVRVKL
jgi:hypothetical protein